MREVRGSGGGGYLDWTGGGLSEKDMVKSSRVIVRGGGTHFIKMGTYLGDYNPPFRH